MSSDQLEKACQVLFDAVDSEGNCSDELGFRNIWFKIARGAMQKISEAEIEEQDVSWFFCLDCNQEEMERWDDVKLSIFRVQKHE